MSRRKDIHEPNDNAQQQSLPSGKFKCRSCDKEFYILPSDLHKQKTRSKKLCYSCMRIENIQKKQAKPKFKTCEICNVEIRAEYFKSHNLRCKAREAEPLAGGLLDKVVCIDCKQPFIRVGINNSGTKQCLNCRAKSGALSKSKERSGPKAGSTPKSSKTYKQGGSKKVVSSKKNTFVKNEVCAISNLPPESKTQTQLLLSLKEEVQKEQWDVKLIRILLDKLRRCSNKNLRARIAAIIEPRRVTKKKGGSFVDNYRTSYTSFWGYKK